MLYAGYVGMNVTCTKSPDGENPSKMGGGRRKTSPSPAFRTDYGFAVADASDSVDVEWPVVDAPHGTSRAPEPESQRARELEEEPGRVGGREVTREGGHKEGH